MTLITSLGYYPPRRGSLCSPTDFSPQDVSVVIPVRDNQRGVDRFLSALNGSLLEEELPGEILIVDNLSKVPVTVSADPPRGVDLSLLSCSRPGPGAARNEGVARARNQWVLFTDSDCVPTRSFVSGYGDAMNGSLGYAGNVLSCGSDRLSRYYDSQGILIPPMCRDDDVVRPEYLVTANALVWRPGFERVGGFNEDMVLAAGEDIDLAFRLRTLGALSYAPLSVVRHSFDDGLLGFVKRFFRYGRGNKKVAELFDLPLRPRVITPEQRRVDHFFLSQIQFLSLLAGYCYE